MPCGYTEISHNLRAKITSLAVHWFNWLCETQCERNVARMWATVPFGEVLRDIPKDGWMDGWPLFKHNKNKSYKLWGSCTTSYKHKINHNLIRYNTITINKWYFKIFTRLSTNRLRKFQLINCQLYMKSAFLCRVVEAEVVLILKSLK